MKIEKNYVDKLLFYRPCVRVLSGLLEPDFRLTNTEEDIVLHMLAVPGVLEGSSRKTICSKLKCSSQSLSGHIKRLKTKGWLDEDGLLDNKLQLLQDNVNKGVASMTVSLWYGGNS